MKKDYDLIRAICEIMPGVEVTVRDNDTDKVEFKNKKLKLPKMKDLDQVGRSLKPIEHFDKIKELEERLKRLEVKNKEPSTSSGKICDTCNEMLPLKQFKKDGRYFDDHRSVCKSCEEVKK